MFQSRGNFLGIATHVFREVCLLLFGSIAVLVLAFLCTASAPVCLLKFIIIKVAKILRPDLISTVNPLGNLFSADLFSPKAPRCSLVISIVFQGHYTAADFQQRYTRMVNMKNKETGKVLYPEYRQYVDNWLGFAFWKNDPHFDIQNHVKQYDCGERGDGLVTVQEHNDLVEELLNKRFQRNRSPWETYIVNNYHNPDLPNGIKTVMVLRVHHTLGDGFSLLYSLVDGVGQTSMKDIVLPTPVYAKRDKWSGLWYAVTFPLRLTHDAAEYLVKGARKSPFAIKDSKKSWRQIYGTTNSIPIQKIKEIKDELGVAFASVTLAAVCSSMAAYAKAKGEVNEREAFFIPFPVPRHPNALTNHVTGAQVDLPMGHFSDRTLRVRDLDRQIRNQKSSTVPWSFYFLGRTFGQQFSSVCQMITANRVNVSGMTSFPMGLTDIRLDTNDGKIVSAQLAAGSLGGTAGLGFMAMSCGNNIFFTVTGESALFTKKDLDRLMEDLREEIDALHNIVTSSRDIKSQS